MWWSERTEAWGKTIIALVAGAVLGYVSEMLAGAMSSPKRATI